MPLDQETDDPIEEVLDLVVSDVEIVLDTRSKQFRVPLPRLRDAFLARQVHLRSPKSVPADSRREPRWPWSR